jgi:hypothetical protein
VSGLLPACLPGPADIEPPPDGVRSVLFIGNSLTYTNDLPGMLELLMEEGLGEDVYVASEALPNYGLPDHWNRGRAQELIGSGAWDFVVLQQGPSATEGRPYLLEYSERFAPLVAEAGGVTGLYMVWPAAARAFDFDGVLDSYRTAAQRVDGLFFPAGEAWRIAWEADPDLQLYGPDGFHPSVHGTYVAALVIYEQIAGLDPRDLPAAITTSSGTFSVEPPIAAVLQEAAHEANLRHRR